VIRYSVQLTEDDLVAGFKLTARLRRAVPVIAAIVVLLALVGLILVVSPSARYSAQHRPLLLLLEGAVGILLLLVGILLASLGRIWRLNARRTLAQRPDLAEPVAYEITPATFRHTTIFADSTIPWSALRGWQENERIFMIYLTDQLFYAIPKDQAPVEAIDAIRAALTGAGVAKR
jgi:hypothetical protein